MNIRKHLQRLFLASTALFWASCGDDANSSSPTVAPGTNIPSDSTTQNAPSDSLQRNETDKVDSVSNTSSQCHEAEKIQKRSLNSDLIEDPVKAATRSADRNAQMDIYDEIDGGLIYNYLEPPKCLQDMLDTLEAPVFLYGPMAFFNDSIATKFVCDDGTTYANEEYLNYQKDLESYEKNLVIFNEAYSQLYEKRLAELQKQLDSCIDQSEEAEEIEE
ncbi:hypothetical protein SAMN05720470_11336 [Fibrobacter sp. UWOV1]|uniref:hypothetical protein n=1 Tax=Fibrobacter sp. UWOV1 TaxID=1896215 RepID=UPI00091EF88B|nr:hypothetical protein [Fibrobacter sp. UWOV1]SHL72198.1 hypothetical protein SAMN05720470_11336 [Fibrobacter sp. UWOV1]